VVEWLNHIKGMTLRNVGVILALVVVAIPSFLVYKLATDNKFASVFFSTYSEQAIPATDCFLRIASVSGGREDYRISRPFAYSGRDRWVVSIETPDQPNADQSVALCNLLGSLIAYARDPGNNPSPAFPGTDLKIFPPVIPIQ
jgi:hypothetical protein